MALKPQYEKIVDDYENEIDMANQLGLNLNDIYDYSDLEKEDSDWEDD